MEVKQCMKCGRELDERQVFCPECLERMEKHPVKPGVVVLLPHRPSQPQKPQNRRKHHVLSLEERVTRLRKWVLGLSLALVLTLAVAVLFGWATISEWFEDSAERFLPGQNYSSQTSQTETIE